MLCIFIRVKPGDAQWLKGKADNEGLEDVPLKWRPETPVSESDNNNNNADDQSVHGEDYDDLDEDDDEEETDDNEEESEEDNFDDVDDLDTFSDEGSVNGANTDTHLAQKEKEREKEEEEEQDEEEDENLSTISSPVQDEGPFISEMAPLIQFLLHIPAPPVVRMKVVQYQPQQQRPTTTTTTIFSFLFIDVRLVHLCSTEP